MYHIIKISSGVITLNQP